MLRHYGCHVPVELWFRESAGLPKCIRDLDGLILRHVEDIAPGCTADSWADWYRTAAMLASSADQVLWFGSDAYPVQDVTRVFDDLDRHGNVFWREVPGGCRYTPSVYGLPESTRETTFTVQGDTMAVDLRRDFDTVSLTHWLNQRGPAYYFHFGWGDQTNFRAAWAILGKPQFSYSPHQCDNATYPHVYLHQGPDGTPMFVHRVGSKWPMPGKPSPFPQPLVKFDGLPGEDVAFGYYQEFCQNPK